MKYYKREGIIVVPTTFKGFGAHCLQQNLQHFQDRPALTLGFAACLKTQQHQCANMFVPIAHFFAVLIVTQLEPRQRVQAVHLPDVEQLLIQSPYCRKHN